MIRVLLLVPFVLLTLSLAFITPHSTGAACNIDTPGRCGYPDIPDPNEPFINVVPEFGPVGTAVMFHGDQWIHNKGAAVTISVVHLDGTREVICTTVVATNGSIDCGPYVTRATDFGNPFSFTATYEGCVEGVAWCYGMFFTYLF